LVELCISEGARMAEPGEFTQRAFLNGRMDLTQAEGVRDTIAAQTDAQLRQANLHRDGALNRRIGELREQVLNLLTAVEASVDFSEEVGDFDREMGAEKIRSILHDLDLLRSTASAGRIIREGLRIAIVGPTNAGKSSLLNALLDSDRSIVTDIPGTTRDFVEETVDLGGVQCVLYDTAGLRQTDDVVEALGVARTHEISANVDLIWYVYDSTLGWTEVDDEAVKRAIRPVQVVANKCDLKDEGPGLHISTLTRAGFDKLIDSVRQMIDGFDTRVLINRRHEVPLRQASQALSNSLEAMANNLPDDLISVGLGEAARHLGEITGESASPDIIDRIFHDFCIGK